MIYNTVGLSNTYSHCLFRWNRSFNYGRPQMHSNIVSYPAYSLNASAPPQPQFPVSEPLPTPIYAEDNEAPPWSNITSNIFAMKTNTVELREHSINLMFLLNDIEFSYKCCYYIIIYNRVISLNVVRASTLFTVSLFYEQKW